MAGADQHSRGTIRPGFARWAPRKIQRAQGRPGVRRTRSLVCSKKAHELVTTGTPEHRPSLRDGITAYTCSPRSAGLVSLRRLARNRCTRLDPSVGRSGPHDFAVRGLRASPARRPRPPHPVLTFAAIGQTPLWSKQDAARQPYISEKRKKNILHWKAWRAS